MVDVAGRAVAARRRPPPRRHRLVRSTPRAVPGRRAAHLRLRRHPSRQYWEPAARVAWLDEVGLDAAVCFPNFGLLWERRLSSDLPAMLANMAAWNRWCHTIAVEGRGRLHPVAHLTLRDVGLAREPAAPRPPRGRHPPGDGRAGAGRRPPALAPRPRPHLVGVRRARHHPGVPRRRPASDLRRLLVHRTATRSCR